MIAGDIERRPAWQVALLWLGLRAAHAAFAPYSERGLHFVWGVGIVLLLAWLTLPWLYAASAKYRLPHPPTDGARGWYVGGGLVVATGLLAVELRRKTFFLSDDNFDQFLPVMTWATRALRAGVLPLWNPHQFLGAPALEVGVYALTYPPTYLACLLADALGQPAWALDIFALTHLTAAYPLACWAARRAGVSSPLASASAVCFTLCGYHLVAGRDWYYMLPSAVFLPLLLGLAARRTEHFVLFAGTACGALFHAGNAQQWAYCTMFFVFVALSTYALREIVRALLLALAVAAPLLVPQLSLVYGLPRVLFGSGDVLRGWHAMVLPFDLLPAPHPMAALWGQTRLLDAAPLYGAGALLPVAALASGVAWLVAKIHARHPFPLATLLAMALALGNHGALWPLLQRLPVFGAFQLPYKLLGVFAALACIAGALTLDRWLGVRGRGAAFAFCAAATLYPCFHALPTNRAWPDADYPKLGLRPDARFVPDAPRRATEPRPAIALAQNLPSFYGLDSALGYDPFVEAMPETRHALQQLTERTPEALRAYGIRYVLKRRVPLAPASDEWPSIPLALPALRELAHDERSVLLEVQDPAPLASTERGPLPSTALVIDGQGITASVPESDHPQTLTLNFLHRARFVASAGTVTHDAWGRMVVRVPPHTTKLALRYRPPFWLGFVVAAAALAACLALGADARLRRLR